ncbi:MAG: hypothetical protein KF718_12945 [Polyangiaceae bacterium]|nr:hypothetical protein [Polyangiaceae bacterium]
MSIQVDGPGPAYLGSLTNPNSLTADALLMYCQSQLNSLDGDIKMHMTQQQAALKHKAALAHIENKMKEFLDGTHGKNHWHETGKAIDSAIESLDPNDPLRADLQQFKTDLWKAGSQKGLGKAEWQSHIDKIHERLEGVKGNAELNMIQLQSIMSQRQTAVQLTTNMLAKYDQTIASIVNNVK